MLLRFNSSTIKTKRAKTIHRSNTPCKTECLSLHQLAQSLGNAVDARDASTFNHSEEVARVSEFLALQWGLSATNVQMIHVAAHLHDIGKIGIPDSILKKAGPLTLEERILLQQHLEIGARIVKPVEAFSPPDGVADIILHHHEHFDGGGYPSGLAVTDIPIGARIVAVADALSALMQHRYYRPGISFEMAVQELERCSGSQFDPKFVQLLLQHRNSVKQLMSECFIPSLPAIEPDFSRIPCSIVVGSMGEIRYAAS